MPDRSPSWIAFWVSFSAWASASGWILSGLGMLNRSAYLPALIVGILILRRSFPIHSLQEIRFAKIRRRFSRPLPAVYSALALFVLIGGAIYAPNNYDFLTYRFPRVLHWSAEHSWFWMPTTNPRINYQAPGFEWMMMPLFTFFHTDRLFFLINFFSFCLLPGLIFSVFRGLGISRRSSWICMWLLPSGFCFILQAGSVGNDAFSTVYFLAALHFALLARRTGNLRFLFLSWLAICLFTGVKLSNVPLILPWIVLVWSAKPWSAGFNRHSGPLALAGILLGLLVSIIPTLILNSYHTGDWTGDPINGPALRIRNPAIGIAGNFLQLASANLTPPVFPWANEWNNNLPEFSFLKKDFPRFSIKVGEIQIEERAGLGLGISLFLLLSLILCRRAPPLQKYQKAFTAAVLVSVLGFLGKFGAPSAARLFAPYYVALIFVLMMYFRPAVQHKKIWFLAAFIATLFAVPVIVLSPSRPLWPALEVTNVLKKEYPENRNVQRAFQVYSVYHDRSDSLAALRDFIPDDEKAVGLIQSGDDPEASLWIPFGRRKVVELFSNQNPCHQGISTVVIHEAALPSEIEHWLNRNSAEILGKKRLITKASSDYEDWYVVKVHCAVKRIERNS